VTDADFPLPYTSSDLTGQVALVTGASSGLGYRFAQVLAAAGATVIAGARRVEKLEALAEDIESRGGSCRPVALDVTDAAQIEAVLDDVTATEGPVQILVNNAGIPDAQRATKMPLELVDAVLDTNIRGVWLMSTGVARRLLDAKLPGRIVNISSSGSFSYAGGGAALYSVTKAAVNRITEVLSVEWGKFHINVNAIAPGAFSSEMMDGMISRVGDFSQYTPRGRLGHPAQLDSTLLYLVSPASEFVTGTVVLVEDAQGPR
jgi:NAD(P)-dependent dehydrogenase (short-subunit alcohol dehydrogenase family)